MALEYAQCAQHFPLWFNTLDKVLNEHNQFTLTQRKVSAQLLLSFSTDIDNNTAAPWWAVQGTDQVAHDQTESLRVEHFNILHIITRE